MHKEYVLITGATGFIGSHVANRLLSEGTYNLIAIVRRDMNYKNVEELKQRGVILVEGKFYDKNIVEKVFNEFPVQYVIHIAALRGGGAGTEEEYHEVNVYGTQVLLEASFSHQVKKFIFCSSVGVFGTIPHELPANVNTELHGDSAYHRSKILAEQKVQKYIIKGLNAFAVRPTITYGIGDNGFPKELVRLVRGKNFLLPRKKVRIHLVSVEKLSELFVLLATQNRLKERVVMGLDKNPITLSCLVDQIYHHFENKSYPRYLRIPALFFVSGVKIGKLFRNEKWVTRFKLISNDWYYQSVDFEKEFTFRPAITEIDFEKYLCSL